MGERAVSTSISLTPTQIDELKKIALENGYNSRNELIAKILTNWLEEKSKKLA